MEGDSKNSEDYNNERSPLLFSSDEDDEETLSKDEPLKWVSLHPPEQQAPEPVKENPDDLAVVRETNRLNRLQELLQGVPPPPSITIPQITCAEVLSLWKENQALFDEAIEETKTVKEAIDQKDFMKITGEEVKNLKWPDVKNVHFYDVYYNLGYCSEEYDRLSQKLRERYVGAETATWCNAVSTGLPNSAKKRQRLRNWGQVSPGSRLSHLARRRQTFSSAGLQQLTSASNDSKAGTSGTANTRLNAFRRSSAGLSERRCIVLDRKNDTKRTTRGSAKKKGASATKEQRAVPAMQPGVQATKRALFQSPEEQRRAVLRPPVTLPDSNDPQENRVLRSKRALWPSTSNPEVSRNVNGKRSLDVDLSVIYQANKVARSDASYERSSRSLPFHLPNESNEAGKKNDLPDLQNPRRWSNQDGSNRVSDMSELHKRKLIWAVSQALRTEGISSKHPDFRPCATALALHYDKIRREWLGPPPTSTSEHMLQVVSARVADVVRSHRNSRLVNSDTSSEVHNRLGEPPFKDASSSLNVRNRSVPILERRVPSARKSLTFDNFDDSSSKSNKSSDAVQTKAAASEVSVDPKSDDLRTNAKRVSRSLFGAENEGSRQASSTATDVQLRGSSLGESPSNKTVNGSNETVNGSNETVNGSNETVNGSNETVNGSNETVNGSNETVNGSNETVNGSNETVNGSNETVNGSNETVNGSNETVNGSNETVNGSNETVNGSNETVNGSNETVNGSNETVNGSNETVKSSAKDSSGESESRENLTPSGRRRLNRNSEPSPTNRRVTRRAWTCTNKKEPSSTVGSSDSSPHAPSQSDSGEVASASASEGFLPTDVPTDLEGSASQLPPSPKIPPLETKVITPILEATAMESSASPKSRDGSVANGDLSFSGRIESLKPAEEEKENNISIDLGLATSASACLLDLKDGEGKEQDLTRWAEMATRSIKKEHKPLGDKCLEQCANQQGSSTEESLYPWIGQSQLIETDSQCPTKLYETYKCIFDSSSQGGNS